MGIKLATALMFAACLGPVLMTVGMVASAWACHRREKFTKVAVKLMSDEMLTEETNRGYLHRRVYPLGKTFGAVFGCWYYDPMWYEAAMEQLDRNMEGYK